MAGQVAMVTGAARGFGRGFAEAFAERDAAVVLVDTDADLVAEVAAAIGQQGRAALAVRCDVTEPRQVRAAVATTIERFGDISVLVNNAALHLTKYSQPFSTLSHDDLKAMFEVNVMGVVNCTLACRPSMARRGGGCVLNISSLAGYTVTSPYGVSKLAVRGLTAAFAGELAADGIRVNAIAPGLMGTESAMADLPVSLVEDFVEHRQLVHRLGTVEDVVAAALFLCGDEASFVTGETLRVTGGAYTGM